MKNVMSCMVVLSAALGLAACSSSEDAALGASAGESLTDYDELADLSDDFDNGLLTAQDTSARTGTATLTGAVGIGELGDDGNLTAVGDLLISADFDTDTATGSADGWTLFDEDTDAVESDLAGSLTLSGGTISGSDFDADLNGTLTEGEEDFDLALTLDGGFFDNGGDLGVAGELTGTITDPDGFDEAASGGFAAVE